MITRHGRHVFYSKPAGPPVPDEAYVEMLDDLARRDNKYRPKTKDDKAKEKAETLIKEGLEHVSASKKGDADNARTCYLNALNCYIFAARHARSLGDKETKLSLRELDDAIYGMRK